MNAFGVSESTIRLSVFLGLLLALMFAEALWPRRERILGRSRWWTNLSMVLLGGLTVRLMGALSGLLLAVGAAAWAASNNWGLLNAITAPAWVEILVAVIVLDALVWAQHWAFHRLPLFWRLHRVHHADRDIDVSTALRFHPLEIALSTLIKVAATLLLGPAVVAVVIFEVLLNGCAMFNHANLRLPVAVDRLLRIVLVTPDMHRVHHSVHAREHHANFGFCLALWDRMFGTYVAAPVDGHLGMRIGLPEFQSAGSEQLGWSLRLPWSPHVQEAKSRQTH